MQPLRIVSSRATSVPIADLLKALDAQPAGEVLAKATVKKQIWVQGYTRADGTVVPTHQAWVHVSDDHDDAKLLAGQGSWSQKQAHAQIAGQPWFQALPAEHKAPVLLHHATSIQEKASADAAVSMFKQAIVAGKVPTPAQAKAFHALPYEKQLEIGKQLFAKQPKTPELLSAAGKHLSAAAPVAAPPPLAPKVVAAAEKPAAVPPPAAVMPPPAEVSSAPDGEPMTLHHTTDGHNKFWSVAVKGSKLTTHYGAIGTKGAVKEKVLHSPGAALAARDKLIGEKLAKGYKHAPSQAMPAAAAAPAPKPAAALPSGLHLGEIDAWPQTGGQKGSNPGGRFKAPDGSEWYCKFPASEDHAKNEVLAAKLYEAAGVKVPELRTVTKGGKLGVASRWVDGISKGSPAELTAASGALEGFAVDAWTGNWDAVGLATDNLLIDKGGAAVRIDVGGALLFRAQGAPKGAAFGTVVGEIDSLRGKSLDPAKNNAQAAAVFGQMTNLQVAQSAAKVLAITDDAIESACSTYGPGSAADRAALAKKLIARRGDIAKWVNKHAGEIVPAKPPAAKKAKTVVAAAEAGPKDGDTKQGAKGTLVFKGGRWHSQAKPAMPQAPSMTGSTIAAATLARMQQAAEAGDATKFDALHSKVSAKAGTSSLLKWKNLKAWADKVKAQYFPAAEAPRSVAAGKKVAAAAEKPAAAPAAHDGLQAAIASAFLPTSNSNHAPANKKLSAIQAALTAGDLPALQAMTFGSNTYGKKAAKLAEQAIAALGGGVAPAPAAPAAPAKVVAAAQKPVPAKKKRLDETKLPVKATDLPPVHDFMNWKGPGSGLSSSAKVNAQNLADEQALLDFAAKGNLVELKAYKYQAIDKSTGAKLGLKPIESHPSTHVKAYHSDLVAFLEAIAHPPKPLDVVSAKAGTVQELAKNAGWEKLGVTSFTAKGEKRLGFFIGLSKATNPKKFAPEKTSHVSGAAKTAAAAKHNSLPKLARHFISRVQSSGTYNNYFRDGKAFDGDGNKTAEVAAVCYEAAGEMPEGTTIYRWMHMPAEMVKQLMAAPDGLVFQNPGSMCCSMSPTATQGFGEHRLVIRYAKGAKAMNSFASGGYAGEQEITSLMGQRFMILKKEMVEGKGGGGAKRLELELLMLPPDPGYVADLKAQAAATMTKSLRVVSARALG